MIKKANILVVLNIFMSVLISLSMKKWMSMWIFLELNSASFMILFFFWSRESCMKFFIIQSISSITLMTFIFMGVWTNWEKEEKMMMYMSMLSIFFKMGMMPIHMWMVNLSKSMSWMLMLLMVTWQKTIPMVMLMKMPFINKMKTIMCALLLIMTALMLKNSCMKKMFIYSSIINMTWMILSMNLKTLASLMYFMVYSIMCMLMFKMMNESNIKHLKKIKMHKNKMEIIVMMISMSTIPPTLMFILKLVLIWKMMEMSTNMISLMALSMSSLGSCYIYLTMLMENLKKMFYNNQQTKVCMVKKEKKMLMTMLLSPMMIMM